MLPISETATKKCNVHFGRISVSKKVRRLCQHKFAHRASGRRSAPTDLRLNKRDTSPHLSWVQISGHDPNNNSSKRDIWEHQSLVSSLRQIGWYAIGYSFLQVNQNNPTPSRIKLIVITWPSMKIYHCSKWIGQSRSVWFSRAQASSLAPLNLVKADPIVGSTIAHKKVKITFAAKEQKLWTSIDSVELNGWTRKQQATGFQRRKIHIFIVCQVRQPSCCQIRWPIFYWLQYFLYKWKSTSSYLQYRGCCLDRKMLIDYYTNLVEVDINKNVKKIGRT